MNEKFDGEEEKTAETVSPQAVPAQTDNLTPENTNTDAERARYNAEKEKEIQKLAQEIEEKNSRNTKTKKRNWWIKTVLLLVLIGVSIGLMFTITSYLADDGAKSFSDMIAGASLPFFFIFIGVVLFYMFLESAKYSYLLKISTGKFRLRNSMKAMFLGKYYDGITPLGTGGQPFQIYYLHKKDIPAGVATAVPLVKYIVTTFVFCIISAVLIIYAGATRMLADWGGSWGETVLLVVTSLSLLLNLAIPIVMLIVSFFPRAGKKLILRIVWLLNKMHIVKHRYPVMKKYVFEANEYKRSLKLLFKKWRKLIPLVALCAVETLVYLAIPFFAVLAIAGPELAIAGSYATHWQLLVDILCLATVSFYSASFVPTPGNSGASEAMTTLVFLNLTGINSLLGWIVLIWRFATYYVYIISGIGINIFEIIRGAVRQRRASKK